MNTVSIETCLRDRIAELEERVRQQQEAFAPKRTWPNALQVTGTKARFLSALFQANGRIVTREALRNLLTSQDAFSEEVIRAHISGLRQQMTPLDLFINTHYGEGYSLTGRSRARLSAMLGEPVA